MKPLLVKLSLGLAVWGWQPRFGLAQTAGKLPSPSPSNLSGVHPSATVEVLEDSSQVDDVIARMRRPAVKTPTPRPVDSATIPIDSLQADRPSLPDDTLDKDTERPVTKAEKRALEMERRRRLHER